MDKTYTGSIALREAKPRSKRLQGTGAVTLSRTVNADLNGYLKRAEADRQYHPLGGSLNLPFSLQNLSFADTPDENRSTEADLEVVVVDDVRYLHTRLPFFSDRSVTAGGRVRAAGGGGGSGTSVSWVERAQIEQVGHYGLKVGNDTKTVSLYGHSHTLAELFSGLSGGPAPGQTLVWDGSSWAFDAAGTEQLQADWSISDISSKAFIKNKPGIMGNNTQPVYVSAVGVFSACHNYAGGTAVTLNGISKAASTASFYAPTGAGSSGQFLRSNGSGEPSWQTINYQTRLDIAGNHGIPVYINADRNAQAIDYLNIGTEAGTIIMPFFSNDLSFLQARGGSCYITGYLSGSPDETKLFNGKPDYTFLTLSSTSDTVTITISLPTDVVYNYGQRFYIDFGALQWSAKYISLSWYERKTDGSSSSDSYKGNITVSDNNLPFWRSSGPLSLDDGYKLTKLVIILSDFYSTTPRISEIGIQRYNSEGMAAAYMSRGTDDLVYRSISPVNSMYYSLGDSSHKWASLYVGDINVDTVTAENLQATYIKTKSGTTRITLGSNKTTVSTGLEVTGYVDVQGNLYPATDYHPNLGSPDRYWAQVVATNVFATNATATGYVKTPVIKNTNGDDKIWLYTNVTIWGNTYIDGSIVPYDTSKANYLGWSSNPWTTLQLAGSASNGGGVVIGGKSALKSLANGSEDLILRVGEGYLSAYTTTAVMGATVELRPWSGSGTGSQAAFSADKDQTNLYIGNDCILRAYTSNGTKSSLLINRSGNIVNRDVNYYAKSTHYFSVNTNTGTDQTWDIVMTIAASGSTANSNRDKYVQFHSDAIPISSNTCHLGRDGRRWENLFVKKWYPYGENGPWIDYVAENNAITVHGNLVATGAITAGQRRNGALGSLEFSGNIIPTANQTYSLGSSNRYFSTVYASIAQLNGLRVGAGGAVIDNLEVDYITLYGTLSGGSLGTSVTWSGLVNYISSGTGGSSITSSELGASANDLDNIISGRVLSIKTGPGTSNNVTGYGYTFNIAEVRGYKSGSAKYYTIYLDGINKMRIEQVGSTNGNWRIYTSW